MTERHDSRPGAAVRQFTIISGGQTGVDRAALDWAIDHGIPHGGWCPRGRLAEDGPIDARYDLTETPSSRYAQRTEWNVRDSDATVVFSALPEVQGGTALTIELAERLDKPWIHLWRTPLEQETGDLTDDAEFAAEQAARLRKFLSEFGVQRLNVAGPRASQEPELESFVQKIFQAALGET